MVDALNRRDRYKNQMYFAFRFFCFFDKGGEGMEQIKGKIAYGGIAIGPVRSLGSKSQMVRRCRVEDATKELQRFVQAKERAQAELKGLYEKALPQVGEEHAAIFEVHQMMLEDPDYCDSIAHMITSQQVNAEFAVATTGDNFAEMFAAMEDEYMRARAADVKDISERVIRILNGASEMAEGQEKPVIILADDLAPSETIQLERDKVLAFVTRKGSTNSHTAILARMMNIPALVVTPVEQVADDTLAIVDGKQGLFIIEPDEKTLQQYQKLMEAEKAQKELLATLKGKESITKDGKKIHLYANIGGVSDVAAVLENDAEGIGLFRSEFLYLQNDHYPTEEEQFVAYRRVLEMMAGKKVIIRTMDIGADKKIDYFHLEEEENPALGYRAVRICLDRQEIFRTQLRALYRAGVYGKLAVMIPMIISVWEVTEVKRIMAEVRQELDAQGIPYGEIELGIMIETPAAVMIADDLAKEVEFFSIGTNDLTQYTLALDRQNNKLDRYYDAHHPAVLRMIQMVIDAAHKAGIWAGICGELGADVTLTKTFVEMGIDELSVAPGMVLPVRKNILEA